MKYQLRYLLHQLEHRKIVQIQESGLVQEWVFPLEKAARQALEFLEQGQDLLQEVGQAQPQEVQALVALEEQVEVLEPWEGLEATEPESGYWKPQSQQQ